MAIDEQGVFAGVADDTDADGEVAAGAVRASASGADELRRKLDTPLFSREPGALAAAQVPGLRELTWDHVTNPTSSVPVVPGESIFGEKDGAPRPAPLKLDDVLPRRDVGLKPLDGASVTGASDAVALVDPPADPSQPTVLPPPPMTAGDPAPPTTLPSATTAAPPSAHAAGPTETPAAPEPLQPLPPATTSGTGGIARPPLPSFSDIVASTASSSVGPATGSTYSVGDSAGVDSLLKPIDEPPPIARETDPLVDGLAELIVRSTPSVGMPRVAELREVSRGDTGAVPSVSGRQLDPPVLDAAVEFANVSTTVPVIPEEEPEITTGIHDAVPGAAVEAEMNRLAFLPDQDEATDGPVEVPAIAYSDVRGADAPPAVSAPTLSTGEVYTPKSSAAPVRHTYADILASTVVPVVRKRKRHTVRKVLTLLVLMGLIGGGMFAVKHFVLDRVQWAPEVEPLAKEVETARGLTFDKGIEVAELPAEEYARRLVAMSGYGQDGSDLADAQLRALGLASGEVDRTAVGAAATPDSPAFYDPNDRVIYTVPDLPAELRTFALHRALTMALLDQRFGWSQRVADQPDVNRRGTVALYDADALAVANALVGDDEELRATLLQQYFDMLVKSSSTPTPSPFMSAVAGRIGLAAWPYMASLGPEDRDLLETDALVTDAKVLDLRRLLDGSAEPSSDPASKGMLFWYHALASRLDPDTAWQVALAWRSDATVTSEKNGKVCTTAELTFDAAAVGLVEPALASWAAFGPEGAGTTARPATPANGELVITVDACDPGAKATTFTQPKRLSLGGAPIRIAQVTDAKVATPSADEQALACAAYGADKVTIDDDRLLIDPALPWPQVAKHPELDPATARCAG